MARIRTVKPEFWTSEQVTECSVPARLLFIGLLNFVDDGGRAPYSPKRIKGQVYPHDDFKSSDIEGMFGELSSNVIGMPLVEFYEVDGKRYFQITGFEKHQRVEYPTYLFPDKSGVIPESKRPSRGGVRRTPAEHSQWERKGMEGNGVEGKGKEGSRRDPGSLARTTRAREGPAAEIPDDWPADYRHQFEDAYPHKVGMTAALEALEKARGRVTWRVVMEAIEIYAQTKPPDRQWANPKTWIEQERWNDRPAKPAGNGAAKSAPGDRARRLARQMEAVERQGTVQRPPDAIGGDELGGDDARLVPGQRSNRPG